nr:cupin domain-containing protein [Pseudonocardia acidicola]
MALFTVAGCLVLAGCAQPGQLGSPAPATTDPPPAPAAPPTSPPPAGPVEVGVGTVQDRVSIRTPGPAVFSVRTVVLAPGATTGWHRLPGTEMSIVKSGSISLLEENACDPVRYGPGQAMFVRDGVPHLARNDGPEPAELVVTSLLAPGAPEREDVPPACPGT